MQLIIKAFNYDRNSVLTQKYSVKNGEILKPSCEEIFHYFTKTYKNNPKKKQREKGKAKLISSQTFKF